MARKSLGVASSAAADTPTRGEVQALIAAAGGGGAVVSRSLLGITPGRFMRVPQVTSGANTATYPSGAMYNHPFLLLSSTTITKIGVLLWGNGTAGALVRLGIYADNNGLPGSLLVDAGTLDATTGAQALVTITLASSLTLSAGQYWTALAVQGAPSTLPTLVNGPSFSSSVVTSASIPHGIAGYSTNAGVVTGALPSTSSATNIIKDASGGSSFPLTVLGA